jgi:D-sedoheptulose 7-phosphate isomerase
MTAIGNDYSFDRVYARQLEARARPGDIFIGISTSGNSTNILRACEVARRIGVTIVGLTGSSGGKMKDLCDIAVCVPAADTPRIQESHILIGHVLCEIVEAELARK